MAKYDKAIRTAYSELNNCIILGLTGRTGSGCTTTSKILETKKFKDLTLPTPKTRDFINVEERKYQIIHTFMNNNWEPFTTIEASSVILSFVLEKSLDDFKKFIEKLTEVGDNYNFHIGDIRELYKKLDGFESLFNNDYCKIDSNIIELNDSEIKDYYIYFTKTINHNKKTFYELLSDFSCYESQKSNFYKSKEKKSKLYSYLMQMFGNNIRSSGDPFNNDFNQGTFCSIAKRLSNIIEIIKRYNLKQGRKTRICIDAIRNPYEAYYLKDTYKCFYLVSVSTDDAERRARLTKFDEEELKSLDDMEYPVNYDDGKIFFQQSIAECLQISDIHLYNPHSNNNRHEMLTINLIRYISLMLHPGLITPTDIERCMQVAYNAKFNSGCLSRQVGAVVTDNSFYVKSIGWNDPPQGQVPCALRTIPNYFSDNDINTFSKFEIENPFFSDGLKKIRDAYNGFVEKGDNAHYSIPYCFKDVYNGLKKDKNQVYTRSLHAEENAFLQISKFGGTGILGGKLFVTASPCELCSKKSYQLGIRDIYYIDPYPGIATSHILKIGEKVENPNLHLFYGAIGNAYVCLYMQRFAIKDELSLVSGINMKKEVSSKVKKNKGNFDDVLYNNIELELIFKNRNEMEFVQKACLTPKKQELISIPKSLSWSGSAYDKTVINESGGNYKIVEKDSSNSVFSFEIIPNAPIQIGDDFSYNVKTIVSDELEIMNPILSHHINKHTKTLKMMLKFDKTKFGCKLPKNVKINLYADIEQNAVYQTIDVTETDEDDFKVYYGEFENPCLFYTYSIEWDFV